MSKIKWGLLIGAIVTGICLFFELKNPFGWRFQGLLFSLFFLLSILIGLSAISKLYQSKISNKIWGGILGIMALLFFAFAIISIGNIGGFLERKIEISQEDWLEDIDQLKQILLSKHRDINILYPSDELNADIELLKSNVGQLKEEEIIYGLMKIVSKMDVSHTQIMPFQRGIMDRMLPLKTFYFSDGLFITDAPKPLQHFVGTKIIELNDISIENVLEKLSEIIPAETRQHEKILFPYYLILSKILTGAGFLDTNESPIKVQVQDKTGATHSFTLDAHSFPQFFIWSFFNKTNPRSKQTIGFQFQGVDNYWFEALGKDILYLQYNVCHNKIEESMAKFCAKIEQYLQDNATAKLILDIRNNTGGNYMTYIKLLRLIQKNFCEHGQLYILTSGKTVSAANNLIRELRQSCDPIIIGGSIGEGTSFYANPRVNQLHKSGLQVQVSSHNSYNDDFGPLALAQYDHLRLDIPIPYTSKQFFEGQDSILLRAIKHIPSKMPSSEILLKDSSYLISPYQIVQIKNEGNHLRLNIHDFTAKGWFREAKVEALNHSTFDIQKKLFKKSDRYESIDGLFKFYIKNDSSYVEYRGLPFQLMPLPENYVFPIELLSDGKWEKVEAAIATFPERVPPSIEYRINSIGYYLMNEGNFSDAERVFQLNIRLFPQSWNVYDSYGEYLLKQNRKKEAQEYYQKALNLNPGSQRILDILKNL